MRQVDRQRIQYLFADFMTANIGFCLFDIGRFHLVSESVRPSHVLTFLCDPSLVAEQILVPILMICLYAVLGSYNRANTLYKSRFDEALTAFIASGIGVLVVFFVALVNDNIEERVRNYELIALLWASLFFPTLIVRYIILSRNARKVRRGDYVLRTFVIGASPANRSKLERIMRSSSRSGLGIKGCVDVDGAIGDSTFIGLPVFRAEDAAEECRRLGAEAVVVLNSEKGLGRTAEIINSLYPLEKPLFVTSDLHSLMSLRPKVSSIVNEPVVDITNARISPAAVNCKRLGDIFISALSLILLSPVLAAIAIAVKADSEGPVLYRQQRIGYHKRPFMINKFRTMKNNAENTGPALAKENDPRVTRIGHFLRKYRLDELPQFWNVLIGEMSLVGPRPEREFYIRQILERHPAYSLIHQVRPGITSWGMVKYGYASNVDQMLERLEYDLLYIENVSLGVDLKILFYTVSTVLTGKGL